MGTAVMDTAVMDTVVMDMCSCQGMLLVFYKL